MQTVTIESKAELEIEKSQFIGICKPMCEKDALKLWIQELWKEHPKATHIVHAAIFGEDGATWSLSDDGEPHGSSARPILDIMKGRELTQTAIIVIRYFGGKKLGVGGLVRAYGDTAKATLEKNTLHTLLWRAPYTITLPYDEHPRVVRFLEAHGVDSLDEEFAEQVRIYGIIQKEQIEKAKKEIFSLTKGKFSLTVGECSLS